jgi:hypothetical protein
MRKVLLLAAVVLGACSEPRADDPSDATGAGGDSRTGNHRAPQPVEAPPLVGTGGAGTGGAPGAGGMLGTGGAPAGTGGGAGAPDALPAVDTGGPAPAPRVYTFGAVNMGVGEIGTYCEGRGLGTAAAPRSGADNAKVWEIAEKATGGEDVWLRVVQVAPGDWRYGTMGAPGAALAWAGWARGEPRTGNPLAVLSGGEWISVPAMARRAIVCEK